MSEKMHDLMAGVIYEDEDRCTLQVDLSIFSGMAGAAAGYGAERVIATTISTVGVGNNEAIVDHNAAAEITGALGGAMLMGTVAYLGIKHLALRYMTAKEYDDLRVFRSSS